MLEPVYRALRLRHNDGGFHIGQLSYPMFAVSLVFPAAAFD